MRRIRNHLKHYCGHLIVGSALIGASCSWNCGCSSLPEPTQVLPSPQEEVVQAESSEPSDSKIASGWKVRVEWWKSEKNNQFYFHAKSRNGRVIFNGEGYHNKSDMMDTIELAKQEVAKAEVVEKK